MKRTVVVLGLVVCSLGVSPGAFGRNQEKTATGPADDPSNTTAAVQRITNDSGSALAERTDDDGALSSNESDSTAPAKAGQNAQAPDGSPAQHKVGGLSFSVDWRFRTEAWDWFQPKTGQNAYAFEHSLLKLGIGQRWENFEWFLQGVQDAIVNLPTHAVAPGTQGQLGLGGSYYVANGDGQNNANGFVQQAYIRFKLPGNGKVRAGRFTFLDGAEVTPSDKMLATIVSTRVNQRLIGDFGFSAVQRSFDGGEVSFDLDGSNITVMGARPTRGVYQIDAMGEVDVDVFYGAYTLPIHSREGAGELRVFAIGYVDERADVLKTDNRPLAVRSADKDEIRIGTYGADYAHVFHTNTHGDFDFLAWGVLQNG